MKENVKEYEAFKLVKVTMPAYLQIRGSEEGKFKSKFMERVTRTPLRVPQIMFFSTLAGFVYYNFQN